MKRIEKIVRDDIKEFQILKVINETYIVFKGSPNLEGENLENLEKLKDYLLEEIPEPYKLTALEYELTKFWKSEGYEWIARDLDGELYIYLGKPFKHVRFWCNKDDADCHVRLSSFKKLFTFVEWSDAEPTRLQDILDNCEVID